ncbi:MAG: T9SS type A sorting domain-containing protein [Bacteroidales bacterium]|nr:T9SS type A sorting domain-containing protein [Bacteroidales bacterium]
MVVKTNSPISNVIGFDMIMKYDAAKVTPTGVVYVYDDLIDATDPAPHALDYTTTAYRTAGDSIFISLYLSAAAPANRKFAGNGDSKLICVEFAKTGAFQAVDEATFSFSRFTESYATTTKNQSCTSGKYTSSKNEDFIGSLKFWKDASPIAYVPAQNLITNIVGGTQTVNPDDKGEFVFNTENNNINIEIRRDIANSTDIDADGAVLITGADALLAAKVVTNDAFFKPSVFQMIAMDVNRDGKVTSGDISQIQQRSVMKLDEFMQAQSHNDDGTKKPNTTSYDWLFVSDTNIAVDKQYRINISYPLATNDQFGYYRDRVPLAPTTYEIIKEGTDCPEITNATFTGIMVGDVNGSYANASSNPLLKSTRTDAVVLDLANAVEAGNEVEIPVYISSNEDVNSFDFVVELNDKSSKVLSSGINGVSNYDGKALRFTSYSLSKYNVNSHVAKVRVAKDALNSINLNSSRALVNDKAAELKSTAVAGESFASVNVYPVPTSGNVFVEVSEASNIMIVDMSGKVVMTETFVNENVKEEINLDNLSNGVYFMKVYNNNFVEVKEIIINR